MRNALSFFLLILTLMSGCASYKTQYVPFRPPQAYLNHQIINGVAIGGEAYPDKGDAKKAFGFDVRGSGLLPVQLVIDNRSSGTLELVPGQTFLVDDQGRYWNVVPNNIAVERVDKFTQGGAIAGGAGKGAFIGAAAGTILGAALGIVSGSNVGSALGKGAALGGAGGAIVGGTREGTSGEKSYRIADDIRTKGLEGKPIPNDHIANGFLFFPGEAPSAKELRLQYRERENGSVRTVVLPLK